MLQNQLCRHNTTIIKGILTWKENIEKKLAGVEECAICFDIVNTQGQLPKKACKTCRKKFHNICILRWFSKSNKSECPLCKSQFL
jgi:NAD-dependent SIR2 family protein deacetylase